MAAILNITLWKIPPAFLKKRRRIFFYKYLKLPEKTRQTSLAEGWSRNIGFGPYYMVGYFNFGNITLLILLLYEVN